MYKHQAGKRKCSMEMFLPGAKLALKTTPPMFFHALKEIGDYKLANRTWPRKLLERTYGNIDLVLHEYQMGVVWQCFWGHGHGSLWTV
jgi:hypothetical protein